MVHSSIDLGTHTCLLLVFSKKPKDHKQVLTDEATLVRLGEGVDAHHSFQPDAMKRTLQCLKKYAEKVQSYGGTPQSTICVATSQARDATNAIDFFNTIQKLTGFSFRILTSQEEGRFTFEGSTYSALKKEKTVVIDIGGGSTEIISQKTVKSMNLGAVRLTERFFKSDPVTDEEFGNCQEAIDTTINQTFHTEVLTKIFPKTTPVDHLDLIAVGGTATTLASLNHDLKQFDAKKIHLTELTKRDIHRYVEDFKWRNQKELQVLLAIEPKRADIILAGSLILWRLLELLDFSKCRVSTQGLRYGVFCNF